MKEELIKNIELVEWIDNETPVNARNLNNIKNKINKNSQDINTISTTMIDLQQKNDDTLQTNDKTVAGGINELKESKFDKVILDSNILKFYADNIEKFSIILPTNQEVDLSEITNSLKTKYDDVVLIGNQLSFKSNGITKKTVELPTGGSIIEGHTHSNKDILDTINSAKVLEWDSKSNFSGSYNDLADKPAIPNTDELATKEELNNKVDKQEGKGLSTLDFNREKDGRLTETYNHSVEPHAPSDAQKNSDITKEEIESKLVGNIESHTHDKYLTEHQDLSNYYNKRQTDEKVENNTIDILDSFKAKLTQGSTGFKKSVFLTQRKYEELAVKDESTLYFIIEGEV